MFLFGPMLALGAAGAVAFRNDPRRPWRVVAALAGLGTAVWLVYAGLYQHAPPCDGRYTGCPTVYGYDPPLRDEHPSGLVILLGGFALGAAWAGSRRTAPPLTIGAALVIGPTALALWTAPRGDDTGLWGLVLWWLPFVGIFAALLAAAAGMGTTEGRGRDLTPNR